MPPPLAGHQWPVCIVHCPLCGVAHPHDLLHSCGRHDCSTAMNGSKCPGYRLLLGVECSSCSAVQEPGVDEMCLTCSAPHGEHVARMCKPGVQAEKAREITAARSALTRKCMLEAQLKRKMSEAISDKRQTQAMLQAAITDRKTEGEVLFAISEIISHPDAWPKYLADILWSRHWDNQKLMNIVCFLAYNGLPYHLMQQWVAVRGVACESRKLGINWENTMQGKWKRGAFTWDLIAKDYCLLSNGEPTTIPESKRSKQSPD